MRNADSRAGASIVVAHGLSCSTARMWDIPISGIEPVCPKLAGIFLTTEPTRKSAMWQY